jgi:hypothetical protein
MTPHDKPPLGATAGFTHEPVMVAADEDRDIRVRVDDVDRAICSVRLLAAALQGRDRHRREGRCGRDRPGPRHRAAGRCGRGLRDRPAEDKFMSEGQGVKRFDVMYNDFVIVGSSAAGVRVLPFTN